MITGRGYNHSLMTILHRLLRKPFFGRFEVPWNWPADVDETGWERVSFANPHGARLAGFWRDATAAPRGTLVLAHPMGKAAKGFWLKGGHAELFGRDFNLLIFDANGFGESEASSFDYPADILAAGLWAQQRAPQRAVGLVGASFGAGWGLCSMARAGSPFRCAILEAAFPTLPEFWRHYPIAYAALRCSQIFWPPLEANLRPEREARKIAGRPPMLLLYGDRDKYTPPAHGERLLAALQTSTDAELHVLEGVDHATALRDARERYIERVMPFLEGAFQRA